MSFCGGDLEDCKSVLWDVHYFTETDDRVIGRGQRAKVEWDQEKVCFTERQGNA